MSNTFDSEYHLFNLLLCIIGNFLIKKIYNNNNINIHLDDEK